MNDRDKLIELLKKADDIASKKLIMDYDDAIADNADYLIANGVTVQEWISVKDRLPEHEVDVLCYTIYQEIEILQFDESVKWWTGSEYDYEKEQVTHWMPLPQPPKKAEEK